MSKNETAMEYTNNIERLMAEMGTPSLKAIATVFGLNPVRIYSVAKQPKEGVAYDPKVYNWDAIERFINRRLDPAKGFGTLEEVIQAALEADAELKANDGRHARRGEGGTKEKIEVDGKMIDKRRYASFEMENHMPVVLKKDPEVYAIVVQTESHTVIRPVKSVDPEEFKGNDIKVISNFMLNLKGVGPSALQEAVRERLSGEYAMKLAAEAQKKAEEATAE